MPPQDAPAADAPARPGARGQQQEPETFFDSIKKQLPLMILMFVATQYIGRKLVNPPPVPHSRPPSAQTSAAPGDPAAAAPDFLTVPLWPLGTLLDVHVALTAAPQPDSSSLAESKGVAGVWESLKSKVDGAAQPALPKKSFKGVPYGSWDWKEQWDVSFKVPASVQQNGSLWLDLVLHPSGTSMDPKASNYDPVQIHHRRKLLSRLHPQKRVRKVKNLLSKEADDTIVEDEPEELEGKPMPIISYYHPNVTVGLVNDPSVLALNKLPPILTQHITALPPEVTDAATGHNYRYPVAFFNDFWILKEQLIPINETVTELPMQFTLYPLSPWKFQLLASMTDAFEKQAATTGGGGELDEVKRMLTETAPWLLITTVIVSILHSVFEFLAFSSDVKHWRGKKELVGVSVRTILTNVVVQLIILLYLMDNSEGTSWMILLGQGVGLVIEAWKITKAVDIKLVRVPGRSLPKLSITDKHVLSEDEKKTQEYDKLAFKYVSWATTPCLAGYTIYSLIYQTHRGWYSFVISTLTSFVYAFGFVQLVPQLIINYKLKSVAHMPMKALMYKTLSTVVDDFFAFCIKMPTLHRLACFRDDVVFVILLYQYWIYKIDYTRVNEYGQGGLTKEEAEVIEKKDEPGESRKDR